MIELPQNITLGLIAAFFITSAISFFLIHSKNRQIGQYEFALAKLKQSFNDLDNQAKLIIKTDLELNKAQEESDKRLNGLEALQKISRLISTTLDEGEIFHRLYQAFTTNLDYERALILEFDSKKKLYSRVVLGFSEESIKYIITHLENDSNLINAFKDGNIFSSVNSPLQRKESIIRIFDTYHFIISPILTQNGITGMVFVGTQSNISPITDGDEELISILSNQIGQALENARLFEEVYRSSQVLESKVQDRTRELQEALREVQDISRTKSDFISAVSHELRTPLTSIKGYASILMDGKLGDIPIEVKQRLGKINTHSDNLVGLINNLLDISRIESGRVEMNFGKCDLRNLIENVRDLLTPQMKDKEINFETDIAANVPTLQLDSSQVERVFINLVGNAIKFTPIKGNITVKADLNDDIVHIQVTDNGIGIPEEDIRRLFEQFFRVDNEINQNVKGTGLGLALAKKIVEAHGGSMWVTSVVKQGTTFHFKLPVLSEEDIAKKKEIQKGSSHG
ncbi:MAG: hypothetical protein KBD53_11750 [Candidatus Omnitrophica bacterium]|nr:hypothetical protein [Candidatus Omnitrophota bacterium]